MTDYFYDEQGRVAGHFADDQPVFVTPAPTGDELDNLLDDCCGTILNVFRPIKRLQDELNHAKDQPLSELLTDGTYTWGRESGHQGVRSWITHGTLRSRDELTPVLNWFHQEMQRRVRLKKSQPDWKFDNDAMVILSSRFGLPTPRTFDELKKFRDQQYAERETERQRQAEIQRQRDAEARQRRLEYEASPEGQAELRAKAKAELNSERIEETLVLLEPFPKVKDPEHPTTREILNAESVCDTQKAIRPQVETLVNRTTFTPQTLVDKWKRTEQPYKEMLDEFEDDVTSTPAEFAMREILDGLKIVAQMPPHPLEPFAEGWTRTFYANIHDAVPLLCERGGTVMKGLDGKFAVDVKGEL
jgi:hypothetical protein